jgi:hypothetical protein
MQQLKQFNTSSPIKDVNGDYHPFYELLCLDKTKITEQEYYSKLDKIFLNLGMLGIFLTDCHSEKKKHIPPNWCKVDTTIAFEVSRIIPEYPAGTFINMDIKATNSVVHLTHFGNLPDGNKIELYITSEKNRANDQELRTSIFYVLPRKELELHDQELMLYNLDLQKRIKALFGEIVPRQNLRSLLPEVQTKEPQTIAMVVGDYFTPNKQPLQGYKKRLGVNKFYQSL